MLRPRTDDFTASTPRNWLRLVQALIISAALGGGLAWLVSGAASAAPGPNPPPITSPTTIPAPGQTNPSSGGTNSGTPNPAAIPRCSRAQLRLKFVDMQGATGHRYIDYAFKNVGATDCRLAGYPRAQLLNSRAQVMHGARQKVGHDPVSPLRNVVIDPGKRAFFTFTWVDGGFCPGDSFAFYALRVFPPRDLRGFARRFGETPACSNSARVSRVRPKLFPF